MPRTYAWRIGEKNVPYVFNVDSSVGLGGVNQRADVLLVQWMISRWMVHNENPEFQAAIDATDVVKIDGICGQKTIAGIRLLERFHPNVIKDGRIDPWGTMRMAHPKIQFLNELVGFTKALDGKVPSGGPVFPDELIPHLFKP